MQKPLTDFYRHHWPSIASVLEDELSFFLHKQFLITVQRVVVETVDGGQLALNYCSNIKTINTFPKIGTFSVFLAHLQY